jgi:hypothetical protein
MPSAVPIQFQVQVAEIHNVAGHQVPAGWMRECLKAAPRVVRIFHGQLDGEPIFRPLAEEHSRPQRTVLATQATTMSRAPASWRCSRVALVTLPKVNTSSITITE